MDSVFTFWGTVKLFSTVAVPFYILTSSAWGQGGVISPTFVITCLFDYSHPRGCEVVSHCDFDFFP
jgi:hypothetical protein